MLITNSRMAKTILFPSSYVNPRIVDEDLTEEYDAAVKAGFDTVIFNYEKWFNNDTLVLNKEYTGKTLVLMRGWMMQPKQYERFYDKLLKRNIELIITPREYFLMHIFPNVYNYIKEDTAQIEIYELGKEIDISKIKFDKFMVKDFVKSVKNTEFPKYFNNTDSQEYFNECMKTFYKYRGNLLTGGICIKEYLDLKKYNDKTNEYRVFYFNNEVLTISKNSGQTDEVVEQRKVPMSLIDKYKNLESNYYTIDFAELSNGDWKIIETGDGQVSGLSDGQSVEDYYNTLYNKMI